MSYILDALRRAEQERQPRQPDLRIVTDASGTHIAQRQPRWPLIAIGGVAAFGLGILVAIPLLRGPAPSAPASPAAASASPAAPAAVTLQAPAASTSPVQAQALDDLVDPDAPLEDDQILAAREAFQVQPEPQVVMPEPEPAAEPAHVQASPPTEVRRIKLAASPVPAVPMLKDMAPEFRAGFPPLSIDVHVYDTDPEKRFVMLNGRRYREGDSTSEGPQLLEITEAGVIVSHNGQRVLLPAM